MLPAASEDTIYYGASRYTGRVFVLVGVAPGETEIAVSRDGDDEGVVRAHVVAQE